MKADFPKRVAKAAGTPTSVNLDECIVRAKAESNKAGSGERFYAWNRVLHALWDVGKLEEA